jgi:uncharacterized protein
VIITDTSFWVALINDKDSYHTQAQQALALVDEPLITTWPVIAETCYLLLERVGNHTQVQFVRGIAAKRFHVFDIEPIQSLRIAESDTPGKAGGLMNVTASKADAPPKVSDCESFSDCAA